MGYELALNRLPVSVLDIIFEQIEIQDLMELIRDVEFTQANPSIIETCLNQIGNRSIIMTNRKMESSLSAMYSLTPSYLDKYILEYLRHEGDINALISLGQRIGDASFTKAITLSYMIWNLRDMCQFMELIESMLPSTLRFNIELEFHPGILYLIDLNYILMKLSSKIEKNIETLQISNFVQDVTIDISMFPSLERLWIENSNVKFKTSFRRNTKLKSLVISPNYNRLDSGRPVPIRKSLPPRLVHLKLGECIIDKRSLSYGIPTSIKSIALCNVRDLSDGQYIENLLEYNLSANLESLIFNSVIQSKVSSDSLLKNVKNWAQIKVLEISNVRERNFNFESSNLEKIMIHQSNIGTLLLPQFLKELNLSDNGLGDISFIEFPPKLEILKLSDNPIDWSKKVEFPNNLRILNIANTGIGEDLQSITFPDSIVQLSLEVNQITSVENVRFPKRLDNLGIGSNRIRTIKNLMVPKTCRTIHFTENRLSGKIDLSRNYWGEELNCWYLYLNYNNFTSFNDVSLPRSIKVLSFDDCKIKSLVDIEFQNTITELSFRGCEIFEVSNVNFEDNSSLKYLCLADNLLTNLHQNGLKIPSNVETINLSGNKISHIQEDYFKLNESLKQLNLSGNRLIRVNLSFFKNLEVLELSFNVIKRLRLSFPRYSETNLASINLSNNKLTGISTDSIGHGIQGVAHNRLIEVDITDNKFNVDNIKDFLQTIPHSVSCVFIGYTGKQDKFGYDIGKNVLHSDVFSGKRIDLSTT